MSQLCFEDFISISKSELRSYLEQREFDIVSFGHQGDGYSIVPVHEGFEFRVAERGEVHEVTTFATVRKAKDAVVDKLWGNAEIQLNHRYERQNRRIRSAEKA